MRREEDSGTGMSENGDREILGDELEELVFKRACQRIGEEKRVSGREAERLLKAFGDRFKKAISALESSRVRRYVFSPSGRIVWTVLGEEREYEVLPLPKFCSCNDFYFRVLSHDAFLCYHLIAQKIAEALERHVLIEMEDKEYSELMSVLREPSVDRRKLSLEEAERIRETVGDILSDEESLSAKKLLLGVQASGFEILTPQHLASVLSADRKKRFKCEKGKWFLSSQPS